MQMIAQHAHIEGSFPSEDIAVAVRYLEQVLKANEDINLTAVRELEKGLVLHIEDSLAAAELARELLDGRFADIGSGCGFPGVALSIVLHHDCDLIDSSSKKMRAVSGILKELSLDRQINVHAGRIEEYALDHREEYSLITARALASIRVVLELASPLLETGGHLLLYKASKVDEEISEAEPMADKVGMRFSHREDMCLSNGDPRSLVVFEKIHEPLITLPRRVGKAQKSPLL